MFLHPWGPCRFSADFSSLAPRWAPASSDHWTVIEGLSWDSYAESPKGHQAGRRLLHVEKAHREAAEETEPAHPLTLDFQPPRDNTVL